MDLNPTPLNINTKYQSITASSICSNFEIDGDLGNSLQTIEYDSKEHYVDVEHCSLQLLLPFHHLIIFSKTQLYVSILQHSG